MIIITIAKILKFYLLITMNKTNPKENYSSGSTEHVPPVYCTNVPPAHESATARQSPPHEVRNSLCSVVEHKADLCVDMHLMYAMYVCVCECKASYGVYIHKCC